MSDLLIFIAGVLVATLFYRLQRDRKKRTREKIEALDSRLEYITKVKESSDEIFRLGFMYLFAAVFLVSIGLFLPKFSSYFSVLLGLPELRILFDQFSMLFFMAAATLGALEFRDYSAVLNFEKAVLRIKKKKDKLQKKYEDS